MHSIASTANPLMGKLTQTQIFASVCAHPLTLNDVNKSVIKINKYLIIKNKRKEKKQKSKKKNEFVAVFKTNHNIKA